MVGVDTLPLIRLIARLVLAWVFISAGMPKIQDPVAFATSIDGFRITGGSLTTWLALLLPWLELVIGIGLLMPWLRRASACIMTALLIAFITLHASAWIRGLDISCGCFGKSADSPEYSWLILRNLALLAIAIFTLMSSLRNKNQQTSSS